MTMTRMMLPPQQTVVVGVAAPRRRAATCTSKIGFSSTCVLLLLLLQSFHDGCWAVTWSSSASLRLPFLVLQQQQHEERRSFLSSFIIMSQRKMVNRLSSTEDEQGALLSRSTTKTSLENTNDDDDDAMVNPLHLVQNIRGGAAVTEEEEEDASEDEEESEDESEQEEETTTPVSDTLGEPVSIWLRTNLVQTMISAGDVSNNNNVLKNVLDSHTVELANVPRRKTIGSLLESCRKQLPGKPPVETLRLVQHGRILQNDILVDELIDDDDDDDDDESQRGDSNECDLQLTIDCVPPVDDKLWIRQLAQALPDMTNEQLLQAYCTNEAALYQTANELEELLLVSSVQQQEGDDEDSEAQDGSSYETSSSSFASQSLVVPQIRAKAAHIRATLQDMLVPPGSSTNSNNKKEVATNASLEWLNNPYSPNSAPTRTVRGQRVRITNNGSGGASVVRRSVQRQFNVHDWGLALRNCLLFAFFGYFGGRTPASRAILWLGVPGVFVLQARGVKLVLRTLLYFLGDHPPGILLSLLPAPQQAILDLNVPMEMERVYGDALDEEGGLHRAEDTYDVFDSLDDDDDDARQQSLDDFVEMANSIIDGNDGIAEDVDSGYDDEYDDSDEYD